MRGIPDLIRSDETNRLDSQAAAGGVLLYTPPKKHFCGLPHPENQKILPESLWQCSDCHIVYRRTCNPWDNHGAGRNEDGKKLKHNKGYYWRKVSKRAAARFVEAAIAKRIADEMKKKQLDAEDIITKTEILNRASLMLEAAKPTPVPPKEKLFKNDHEVVEAELEPDPPLRGSRPLPRDY